MPRGGELGFGLRMEAQIEGDFCMAQGTRTSWPALARGRCLAEGLLPQAHHHRRVPSSFSGHLVTVREACCFFSCCPGDGTTDKLGWSQIPNTCCVMRSLWHCDILDFICLSPHRRGANKELNSSIRTAARVDMSVRLCGACPCARHSFVFTTVLGVDTVIPT